ncbi:hypothetical protein BD309DRAFT_979930 [Dichomitus squalens]|uniref:Uncharacterized protein n=1 Tax=Dichomitus squalens TaxID=114155 RepID=A0A4Q9NSQ0_9APHY|nr:uncharacterized protein DICSQDRAFT_134017 [Dichomitus squalens LYAD-421 SS1]EJF64338.1 hypothetical protein DICSQDRAFT_134017 [Dichomitus squalens LYAD-421 SS1]TBU24198.1 hypothetical protein BD311DRAFT_672350 [Dichomitus squalens]TBU44664.1 hypothetical protein BD309DRAFT_979930 [Dichomitus squalens]TBU59540.1 hypothetical protein BD310DRAFT_905904 [Dichomitus squalens]
MQLTIATLVLAAMLPTTFAANCQNSGGVANGECVKFYSNDQCKGDPIGSFKPTCEGNCFQFDSFSSVFVSGDGTFGTDCTLYSDDNCSVEQTDTGNVVVGGGKCAAAPNAKSMKCFYRC